MDDSVLKSIREAEKKSHEDIYSTAKLFEKGSWLQKPVKTVLDILPLFYEYKVLNVLDLGCGVGRNCIPIADKFKHIDCRIDCVDILDLAIDMLNQYSKTYYVSDAINGIVSSIDDYGIEANRYDFILCVSALEHINSEKAFVDKLFEIREGTKENGVVCLIVNSEIIETDKSSGKQIVAQFEVNLKTEKLFALFENVFSEWSVLKSTVVNQKYDIPRENGMSELSTNVVTYVIKNKASV